MEFWIGKVVKVLPQEGEDVQGLCARILAEKGKEKATYHDSYLEALTDTFYEQYISHDGVLYDLSGAKDIEEDGDLCQARLNADGSIEIGLRFYNGGTCLREMFDEAMGKLTA